MDVVCDGLWPRIERQIPKTRSSLMYLVGIPRTFAVRPVCLELTRAKQWKDVAKIGRVSVGLGSNAAARLPRPTGFPVQNECRLNAGLLVRGGVRQRVRVASRQRVRGSLKDSYLVDPASSHMLVSKIKPCMSKYKH